MPAVQSLIPVVYLLLAAIEGNAFLPLPSIPKVVSSPNTVQRDDELELLNNTESLEILQEQAKTLREEADQMQQTLDDQKEAARVKRTTKIDSWIEQLLVQVDDGKTQLLKSEEEVLRRLQDGRFSQEQINAIFDRLCEIRYESRSKCSPLMELLVDSVGRMDCVEDNPNKRWSGKVERVLRRRLFAKDWNMDIEDEEDNIWRI